MRVAPGVTVVAIVGKVQVSGHESRRETEGAKRRNHEHREVATASASKLQRPGRILDSPPRAAPDA